MKIFIALLFLFIFGSTLGYVIEVIFRRYVSMKRWINPGFCHGPWLPIYGFGTCFLYLFFNFFAWFGMNDLSEPLKYFLGILFFTLAATLIEYLAGLIFIKQMKIRLWDYSNLKGNIQGIICPEFTFLWLCIGVIYFLLLGNYFNELVDIIYDEFYINKNIWLILSFGTIYGLFFMDLAYSTNMFHKISKAAKESKIVIGYEAFKIQIKEKAVSIANKSELIKGIQSYFEDTKKEAQKSKNKISSFFLIDPSKKKKKSDSKNNLEK